MATLHPREYFNLLLPADVSGIIPKVELDELKRDMDPEEFAQEYMCSFDAAIKGAIYASEINELFYDGRVRSNLYDPDLPTYVAFDLGFTDATVAVYWQEGPDGTIRVVRVHATTGQDIFHHMDALEEIPGGVETIWLPHDARARNLQTGRSMVEQFLKQDYRPSIVPNHKVRDRIMATRRLFPVIWIDEEACGDLIEALKGYHRTWSDERMTYEEAPYHDWTSDYADAFGYMAMVCSKPRGLASNLVKEVQSEFNLTNLWYDREHRSTSRALRIA